MVTSYCGASLILGLCCGLSMITSASRFVTGLLNKVVARGSSEGLVVVVKGGASGVSMAASRGVV
jgi:hypothetical protein